MQVCADGVGKKALPDRAGRDRPKKTSSSVADVEEHSALPSLDHPRLDFSGEAIDQFHLAVVVHMSVNVAGTQMLQEFGFGGAFRIGENFVVHHHGNVRPAAGFDGAIDGRPSGFCEVRRLDADDDVPIFCNCLGSRRGIHIADVAFVRLADHPFADDIHPNKDASGRVRDHGAAKFIEGPPTAAAGVANRGGSGGQRRIVRCQRTLVSENMSVQIDQTGNNDQAGDIDDLARLLIRDVRSDSSDPIGGDRDVHGAVNIVCGIDHPAAAEYDVVLLRRCRNTQHRDQAHACSHEMHNSPMSHQTKAGLSRRRLFQTGGAVAAGLAAGQPVCGAAPSPDVYTRIGVRPFINCTATLTINGGSLTLPEVIAAMEQAAHFHVDLDELMERVSARLAELLRVEWAIVTAGTAAALTHATAACLVGTDPEKIQRLPNLEGLKDEVIIPRESRNAYDHAIRTLGVKIIEVNNRDELRKAIGPHTAMIEVLGNYFGKADFDLKDVAPIAKEYGVPILIDAAADYLIVPNPYIALGADLVAYSGGKIIRGTQGAGLLVGRKDLVRAAWANSAPHHAFGRALKVTKEEIAGMLAAVEVWRGGRDIEADFQEWTRWYAEMSAKLTKVPGISATVIPPVRGGPFPTLRVSWDARKFDITAGDVGRKLLEGEPRIMTQAAGDGNSFLIRPVAMKPGEYLIVAERLLQVLSSAPEASSKRPLVPPSTNIAGVWDLEIQYEVGAARHKLFLTTDRNQITGTHQGWAYQGDLKGLIEGDRVTLRSTLPADGNVLNYSFTGAVSATGMAGEVRIGEYGKGRWQAVRHLAV